MTRLLRKFMGKFIKSRVIAAETTVDFKSGDHHLPDNILAVGLKTRELIHPDNDVPPEIITKFYRQLTIFDVRAFYIAVTEKMVAKFPFKNDTLKTLGYLNPKLRQSIDAHSVGELAKRLGYSCSLDELQDQYQDYQLSPMEELPSLPPDCCLDAFWIQMEEVTLADRRKRFPLLSQLSLIALSLPHSNADTERSFSILEKIQTDMRENLSHKTVHSLMELDIAETCVELV
ncbi:hypothetical protein ScPMuIL_018654 [Solemya velum]